LNSRALLASQGGSEIKSGILIFPFPQKEGIIENEN
jgi:hypothetical protein